MNKLRDRLTLALQNEVFRKVNVEMREIYSMQKKDREVLISAIGDVLTGATIEDSRLDLALVDKRRIRSHMDLLVGEMTKKHGYAEESMIREILSGAAIDKYNIDSYVMSIGREFGLKKLTEEQVANIVDQKISGKMWSDRIWNNKDSLKKVLKKDIRDLVNGNADIEEVIGRVGERFNQNANNSERLVNTELARVQDESNNVFAREHGIQKQMFLSTLDSLTSSICAGLDGEIFDIDDPSKPSIPLHPNCRSVMVNIIDDWEPTERKDGNSGNYGKWSTFKEWESDNNM